MRASQLAVLVISLLGMVFSGLGLSVTYLGAERLERPARAFIEWQGEKRLRQAFAPDMETQEGDGVLAAARSMVGPPISIFSMASARSRFGSATVFSKG